MFTISHNKHELFWQSLDSYICVLVFYMEETCAGNIHPLYRQFTTASRRLPPSITGGLGFVNWYWKHIPLYITTM